MKVQCISGNHVGYKCQWSLYVSLYVYGASDMELKNPSKQKFPKAIDRMTAAVICNDFLLN